MKIRYRLLLVVFLLLFTAPVFAQAGYEVSGTVSNENGEPLKGATVFIGGSTRIMPTDEDGHFTFKNISPGSFQLSVQMIGYAPVTQNIVIKNAPLKVDLKMLTRSIALNQVTIGKKRAWKRNFELFKGEFLGQSANGRQCVIVNPQVINFSTKKGALMADADDFLIIENKRLGYRVRYLLTNFSYNYVDGIVLYHGECSFEDMDGTDEQKNQWTKNRLETYQGSFTHFLRSVYANNTVENGFIARPLYSYGTIRYDTTTVDTYKVIVKNRPVKFDSLLTPIDTTFTAFRFKQLYVIYDPKNAAKFAANGTDQKKNIVIVNKASLLRSATDVTIIDQKGSYTDYRDFFIQGFWAKARVGDQLPVEYKPPVPEIPRKVVLANPLLSALERWKDSILQEKAYLHMDKPYYAPGDTLWFKGYLVNGSSHQLSAQSGAAYVDLINDQNQAVKKLKLPVNSGTIAGDLALGEDITPGSYRIRAYTRWMRNAGEDYFFNRTFTIGSPINTTNKKDIKPASQPVDIQFFPESGNLINGIISKVGFKAVGADGLGVAIRGTVTDNENHPLVQISTQHAGMGSFLLQPANGKTYIAHIKLADSTVKDIPLPTALNQGYVLSVYQPGKDSVLVRIRASAALQHSTINLFVHSSGKLIFASQVQINSAMTSVWMDKNSFPSGIAQFTIFDDKNDPLNERIAFIKNADYMQLALSTEKPAYKSNEHVQLQLDAKESQGNPVAANFSIAVTDETKVPVDESTESTIFSSILLSSDIKGYVEKPNYYFMPDTDGVNQALDNLMLTQGYRRFEWKKLNDVLNTPPTFAAEGLATTLSGMVTTLQHQALPNANVLLVSINARIKRSTLTDINGRFKFDSLMFADSAKFAVQASTQENTGNVIITLDSIPAVTTGRQQNLAEVNIIKTSFKKAVDEGKPIDLTGHLLRQVNIKDTRINKITKDKDAVPQAMYSLPDEQSADNVITIPNPEAYLTLEQYLQGRLAGIRIGTTNTGLKVLLDSRPHTELHLDIKNVNLRDKTWDQQGRFIGLIVNGRKIDTTEADRMLTGSIMPEEVAKIEIVRNNQAMVNYLRSAGDQSVGFLLILTKPPSSVHKNYDPNIVNISPKGFNAVRQFYSPRYDHPTENKTPDLRTTIYWNPYVNTDANGKATLDFYNADAPGTYRVVVEGINAAGELGRQVYKYKVE